MSNSPRTADKNWTYSKNHIKYHNVYNNYKPKDQIIYAQSWTRCHQINHYWYFVDYLKVAMTS